MKNKHWFELYPQGTEQGEKEQKFFISIARDPNHVWKTVRTICSETGLSTEDVEKIIDKYIKIKMIVSSPESDYEWAYYERIEKIKTKLSITEENQIKRIKES